MAFHTKTYEPYRNIQVKPNQPCNYLNRGHKSKVNIFEQYKLLREPKTRSKRGIFSFMGDVMGSLFGVLTSADIEKIQQNIKTLHVTTCLSRMYYFIDKISSIPPIFL